MSMPLGLFRIFLKIPGDIRECMSGVNDTGDKLLPVSPIQSNKIFTGVVDTGDKTVLPISAYLHMKMKKTKFQSISVNCT